MLIRSCKSKRILELKKTTEVLIVATILKYWGNFVNFKFLWMTFMLCWNSTAQYLVNLYKSYFWIRKKDTCVYIRLRKSKKILKLKKTTKVLINILSKEFKNANAMFLVNTLYF